MYFTTLCVRSFGTAVHWWGVLTDLKLIWNKLLQNFITKLPRVFSYLFISQQTLTRWGMVKENQHGSHSNSWGNDVAYAILSPPITSSTTEDEGFLSLWSLSATLHCSSRILGSQVFKDKIPTGGAGWFSRGEGQIRHPTLGDWLVFPHLTTFYHYYRFKRLCYGFYLWSSLRCKLI